MRPMPEDPRKAREAEFHNRSFEEQPREHLWPKYYRVVGESDEYYKDYIATHGRGQRVLDYGCGLGHRSLFLGRSGAASVVGVDLSEVAIEKARAEARREGIDNLEFQVMDAEALTFPDDSFDLVCGSGVIHHLHTTKAYSEISRVLRPHGSAIFVEPLGHNPAINAYRRLTPRLRTPDEHPLLVDDLSAAGRYFGRVELDFFHLLVLLAVPLRKLGVFPHVVRALSALDRLVFRLLPFGRRYAWHVIMRLYEPRSQNTARAAIGSDSASVRA